MSYSISTLLLRNLSDVFGENDPVRRRAAIDAIFHEDAVFHDPKGGIFRGRDEIDRIAGATKATHPDFDYQPLFPPEELGDAGRVRWLSGTPGKPPAYAGTDFIVARNGRIASVYLFSTSYPELPCDAPWTHFTGLVEASAAQSEMKHEHLEAAGDQAVERTRRCHGCGTFLTSDDAVFITGQAIVVDGGQP